MSNEGSHPGPILATRYRIEAEIGRGGMSVVYRAHDLRHDRPVAVKVLRPEIAASLGEDRFRREIEIEARLQHPHILPVYDSGTTDDSIFFVMPYVEGETLADRLEREGPLSPEEATRIVVEVADALQYAHDRDIVHRDVKPSNVLLSSGHALVADFGIARAISSATGDRLTASGITVGTPVYMSPEQAEGQPVDGRTDVYALGSVLYEMLVGRPPFEGETVRAVLAKQLVGTIPSIEATRKDLPGHFEATIQRALQKDPEDRFDTVADLAAALSGDALPFGRAWRRRQRRRALAWVVGVVAVAAAGWLALRAPQAVALDSNRILVFPLTETDLPADAAGTGLDAAVLIITLLEYAEPLKWDDGWRWMLPEHQSNPALMTADSARDIATSLRARFFLEGEFLTRADSAVVLLRLHDVAGDSVYARQMAAGPLSAQPYAELTRTALAELLPVLIDPGRPQPDLSAVAERTPTSINAYLHGERAYRLARYGEAQTHYQRALELDSLFAFAALKGSLAAEWTHDTLAVADFMDAVEPQAARLPARYAGFFAGLRAYHAGLADSAIAAYETVAAESPDWPEVLTALGETHYHRLPTDVPDPASEAERYFEAAVTADPGFAPPLLHLTEIAARAGDLDRAAELHERYRTARPTYGLGQLDLLLRCAAGGPGKVNWAEEASRRPLEVFRAARSSSIGMTFPGCARAALTALQGEAERTSEDVDWGTFFLLQNVLLAEADYRPLRALLQDIEGEGRLAVPYLWVIDAIAGAPFADSAAAQDAWLRDEFGQRYEELRAPMALWVASIWNAHVADTTRLRLVHQAFEEVARDPARPALWRERAARFGTATRADLLRLAGDGAGAIAAYESIRETAPNGHITWELGDPMPFARLRRSELLLAAGRYEEAIAVASVFDAPAAIVFDGLVPNSLAIRLAAARAAGLRREEREFRRRLEALGRTDLIEAAAGSRQGGPGPGSPEASAASQGARD